MMIHVSTDKGKVKVISTFPLSRSLQKKIQESLKLAIEDVKPIDSLIEKIRKGDPVIGTPRGTLIAHMTSRSWTQKRLAQETGISQADISKMVHGKRSIGPIVAKKLAKAFGIDYRKFL